MKVTDLMVGDWVYNKHHKKNIQITPYDFFNHGHNGFGKQFLPTNPKLISGNDFDPIPLTEEILVKNGYKSTQGLDFYWLDDKKHLCIKNYDGKRLVCYKHGINDVWLVVKYVHQLQHLLRLCGIEKELVID